MSEIKERAIAKYCTHCGARTEYNCFCHATPCNRIKNYIIIATEQRAIDIEKACDAYCHHCPNYADDAIGLQGCSGGGCDVLRDFRKAMED